MKQNVIKIVFIISIVLNVVLLVLWYNSYKADQINHATGDSGSYRVFVHFLEYSSHYLGELGESNDKKANMNSLINANSRLQIATNSFEKFKNSMSSTKMFTMNLEISLEGFNETMISLMSNYALDDHPSVSGAKELKDHIDELVKMLPDTYDPQQRDEFIKRIN